MPDDRFERVRVVTEEAAYWYIRCTHEPEMELSGRRELLTWLQRSPENIAALLHISVIDARLARDKSVAKVEIDEASFFELGIPETQQQHKHTATTESLHEKRVKKVKFNKAPLWKVAAAAAAMTLATVMVFEAGDLRVTETVSTAAGQRQHITLPDGSVVHTGPRTRLKVEFSDERRIVHAYHGEAVFEVAKDSARPFAVITPLMELTAVGTRFGVSIASGVTATVSEGVVRANIVRGGKESMLHAGEQLQVSETDLSAPALSNVDAVTALEWANGFLVFRSKTIREAAMEFNRHNLVQIEIEHDAIAARALSYYRGPVDSPSKFAQAVADRYGFELIKDPSGTVLRLRLDERY